MKARLFFIGISLLFLVGCAAARQDNTLLENASPDTSAMELYIYDGHTATRKFLYDSEEEKEILQALASVPVQKAEDHTLADVKLPIYGIRIGGAKTSRMSRPPGRMDTGSRRRVKSMILIMTLKPWLWSMTGRIPTRGRRSPFCPAPGSCVRMETDGTRRCSRLPESSWRRKISLFAWSPRQEIR